LLIESVLIVDSSISRWNTIIPYNDWVGYKLMYFVSKILQPFLKLRNSFNLYLDIH
jgi:hypothetical protein